MFSNTKILWSTALLIGLAMIGVYSCWSQYFQGRGQQELSVVLDSCLMCSKGAYGDQGVFIVENGISYIKSDGVMLKIVDDLAENTCENGETIIFSGKIRKLPWEHEISIHSIGMLVPLKGEALKACYLRDNEIYSFM